MKQTVELTIPDGYVVAEGEQPRIPKKGEFYLTTNGEAKECFRNEFMGRNIVLKKKEPKYRVEDVVVAGSNQPSCKMVEIKALEDAVRLLTTPDYEWRIDESTKLDELKELIR